MKTHNLKPVQLMEVSYWQSWAEWPEGLITAGDAPNCTMDKHETKEQAKAVCQRLQRDGFGGDGKHFPVKTWFVRVPVMAC